MHFKIAVSDKTKAHFSLKKADADFSTNQIVLNALVGTLVKYGPSGRIEPYLAESWNVSIDKKIWQFKIRKGFACADGTLITANLIHHNLIESLKNYSARGSVIMFDHLSGWDDFVKNKTSDLKGLSTQGETLEFRFTENPDDLLELLRMPYFGLWVEKDGHLISSGPYTVESYTDSLIKLGIRQDWFTADERSFKSIEVSFVNFEDFQKEGVSDKTIVRVPFYVTQTSPVANSYWVTSPPTRLESFVLSPTKKSFFDDPANRAVFRNRVNSLDTDLVKSKFFYSSASTKGLNYSGIKYSSNAERPTALTFAIERATCSEEEIQKIEKIILFALEGSGQKFELLRRDMNDKDWFKKTDTNHFFDARVASVDIGGYPNYTAIKMMFCTKLGINFPDHNGRICKIVTDGIQSAKNVDKNFIDDFNKAIHEDAVVIPLFHHSDKWLVSDDLDPVSLPPTTLYPQFELIRSR